MTSCSVLAVCVIWSQAVCYMVSTGEEQCARGKFRVIMQYMEPHCIAELEDGWQSIGRVQTCAQTGLLGEGWDVRLLYFVGTSF